MTDYLLVAVLSYLLGSVPFGYLLVRMLRGQDIRESGSGNIGATNVLRSGAPGLGLTTLVLDAGKGALAVLFALWREPTGSESQIYLLGSVAALFAIAGHIFPVWLKFRGGKGVATAIGSFLVLAPVALVLTLLVFALTLGLSRFVSLGSIIAVGLFPLFLYLFYPPAPFAAVAVVLLGAAIIIASHHQNIRRLLAGNEHRLGMRRA